jgi:hypothetical protein
VVDSIAIYSLVAAPDTFDVKRSVFPLLSRAPDDQDKQTDIATEIAVRFQRFAKIVTRYLVSVRSHIVSETASILSVLA